MPSIPNGPQKREGRVSRTILSHLSLKVPGKSSPIPRSPSGSLWREVHFQNQWFINSLISFRFSHKEPFQERRSENVWSPSTEPHVDGIPIYNGVRSRSPSGSFNTQQSVPQCHDAFNTVPSTLAWVDQSPVSQPVS